MIGAVEIRRLGPSDLGLARQLNTMFAAAFDDQHSYASAPPADAHLQRLLGRSGIIALVGLARGEVVGGLVAYVLDKLEQERSEIYIYDLAVAEAHRRGGVATALINEVKRLAAETGAWMIYVQADHGDDPAIVLYEGLGTREEVLHFDIVPAATSKPVGGD